MVLDAKQKKPSVRPNPGGPTLQGDPIQILRRFAGTIQQYLEQISDADLCRPDHCPLCHAKHPLIAWGFYGRTLVDLEFNDLIPVRRSLCDACRRTSHLGGKLPG